MKQLPKRSGEYLFEIILRRYETRSTLMTSNRPLDDWGKLIGDVPSATAILDRFLHHAEVIHITGRSYRLRNQSQNQSPVEKENRPPAADRSLTPRPPSSTEPAEPSTIEAEANAAIAPTGIPTIEAEPNAAIAPTGSTAKKSSRSWHPPTTK